MDRPSGATRHDVEAEAEGDGDLHRVERDVADGAGEAFGGGQLDGVGEAHRLLAEQRRRPVEAALVDGHDGVAVPLQSHGVLEVEAQRRLVGEPVDDGERLGEREGADAHGGVGVGRAPARRAAVPACRCAGRRRRWRRRTRSPADLARRRGRGARRSTRRPVRRGEPDRCAAAARARRRRRGRRSSPRRRCPRPGRGRPSAGRRR